MMKGSLAPRVSVILPVYNAERFIESAVNSILSQSFTDFELIILNDGSTDSTFGIIERLAVGDSRIKIISTDNYGLVSALNTAIGVSRGDYIARMDGDDIALNHRLKCQLDYFHENEIFDIIGGQALVQDRCGNVISNIDRPISPGTISAFLRYGCPLIHPTYMVKSSVYRSLGGYRDIPGAEDLDFLIRASLRGFKLGNVASRVLIYTSNPIGISSVLAFQQLRNTRILLADYRKNRVTSLSAIVSSVDPGSVFARFSRRWFNYFYSKISSLVTKERKGFGIDRAARVLVFSLMHYELLFFLSRTVKRKYYLRKYNQKNL